jgi:N-acetylneuraminic acid mutarotase
VSFQSQSLQDKLPRRFLLVPYLYAIGGKSSHMDGLNGICQQKTIERYDIERDKWTELRMQLNYGRAFLSAVTFGNRYIYVIGGNTNTDCFEIIDTFKEDSAMKTDLVLLELGTY